MIVVVVVVVAKPPLETLCACQDTFLFKAGIILHKSSRNWAPTRGCISISLATPCSSGPELICPPLAHAHTLVATLHLEALLSARCRTFGGAVSLILATVHEACTLQFCRRVIRETDNLPIGCCSCLLEAQAADFISLCRHSGNIH